MMFFIKNKFVFLYLGMALLSFVSNVNAQTIEVGLSGGGAYLLTDSVRAVPFEQPGWSAGGVVRYNFNTRWSARFSYNYMNFKNVKPFNDTLSINDVSLVGEFNFFDYDIGSEKNNISPYLFGGISGLSYKISSDTLRGNAALTFGVGLKYSLSDRIGMGFEWGMRKTFTDKLDRNDIDGTFFYGSDWYNFTGISITYKFNVIKHGACR